MRDVERQRLGNGLSHIDVTPMQVARAYAGLATGSLPDLRLVRASGDEPFRVRSRPLPIEPRHLQRIQSALGDVVAHRDGSAHGKGLGRSALGFAFAAKTGSADYLKMTAEYRAQLHFPPEAEPQMRKHTWFVGFFPARAPTTVVVVFCHDIGVTSSHSAVHVAAQFLKSPEVQAYVQGAIR